MTRQLLIIMLIIIYYRKMAYFTQHVVRQIMLLQRYFSSTCHLPFLLLSFFLIFAILLSR